MNYYPSVNGSVAVLTSLIFVGLVYAENTDLPRRISAVPATTNSVPHVQIGVESDPTISAELLRRVADIDGVQIQNAAWTLPGAKGFVVDDSVKLERADRVIGGREFAHLHPDGSLHLSLSLDVAVAAVRRGWATFHPWSTERSGWDGLVMIYTPQSMGELPIVLDLIQASFDYVTEKP